MKKKLRIGIIGDFDPEKISHLINKLSCSLVGETQTISIHPGSLSFEAYGKKEAVERYRCNYGLNSLFQERLSEQGVLFAGTDSEGEVRIIELPVHRFYMATLFLPQFSSTPDQSHPLILAFIKSALKYQNEISI